jgi:hypothetical protein
MKVRHLLTKAVLEAVLSTEHPASSYGQPVLVAGGVAYGTGDEQFKALDLVEATDEERAHLERAGYHFTSDAEAGHAYRLEQAKELIEQQRAVTKDGRTVRAFLKDEASGGYIRNPALEPTDETEAE